MDDIKKTDGTENITPDEAETPTPAPAEEAPPDSEKDTEPKKKDKKLKDENKKLTSELAALKKNADELKSALAASEDKYLRMLAEYDNFRRRSQKEREQTYTDAYSDAVSTILPLLDNLGRAMDFADSDKLADGIALIVKSVPDILGKLGVEEIEVEGKPFDPNVAQAVMRVEDGDAEENTVVAVMQKGYRRGDRVIRHAMVSVKA